MNFQLKLIILALAVFTFSNCSKSKKIVATPDPKAIPTPAVVVAKKTIDTTANGFRIIRHTKMAGQKPVEGDQVSLSMKVFLSDTLIHSADPKVAMPPAAAVQRPSPILDALYLMAPGDSATVFQKIDAEMREQMPPGTTATELRYEIKLISLISAEAAAAEAAVEEAKRTAEIEKLKGRLAEIQTRTTTLVADFAAGKMPAGLKTLPSGLQMLVHEQGTGAAVTKGENLDVHYYGCLTDGKMFDNSFERGEPIAFQQGMHMMIPGFDEGAGQLNHGGKATLFIPSSLGYGDEGAGDLIPPKATLVFYIEVQ